MGNSPDNFFLTRPNTAKERFESKVYPDCNVLQDLAVYLRQLGTVLFDRRKYGVLVIQGKRFLCLLIHIFTLGKQVVVQKATLFKHFTHLGFLLTGGQYPVLKGFTHSLIIVQNKTFNNLLRRCGCIPYAKARGISHCESW